MVTMATRPALTSSSRTTVDLAAFEAAFSRFGWKTLMSSRGSSAMARKSRLRRGAVRRSSRELHVAEELHPLLDLAQLVLGGRGRRLRGRSVRRVGGHAR